MKYNIVLVPKSSEVSALLIDLARKISLQNGLEPIYLLKDTGKLSIPHLSVFQFEVIKNFLKEDDKSLLPLIWNHVSETWQEVFSNHKQELFCSLPRTINYKNDVAGIFAGVTWAEIVVNKIENFLLQEFHDELRKKLEPLGIKCLNAFGERYNPHFTLFNIRTALLEKADIIKEIPEFYMTVLKSFSLKPALGVANDNWELTNKIYEEQSMVNPRFRLQSPQR